MESIQKNSDLLRLPDLQSFGDKVNKFDANFAVCNVEGQLALLRQCSRFRSNKKLLADTALLILEKNYQSGWHKTEYVSVVDNRYLGIVLKQPGRKDAAALIDLGTTTTENCEYLKEMLLLFAQNYHLDNNAQEQIAIISNELAHVYEELMLLHKLSTNMKITEQDINFVW